MEILLFFLIGVLGGFLIKGAEYVLSHGIKPVQLDYNKRWEDRKYVELIHRTRDREQSLGFELTECECLVHKPVRIDKAPKPKVGQVEQAFRNAVRPHQPWRGKIYNGMVVESADYDPNLLCYNVVLLEGIVHGKKQLLYTRVTEDLFEMTMEQQDIIALANGVRRDGMRVAGYTGYTNNVEISTKWVYK